MDIRTFIQISRCLENDIRMTLDLLFEFWKTWIFYGKNPSRLHYKGCTTNFWRKKIQCNAKLAVKTTPFAYKSRACILGTLIDAVSVFCDPSHFTRIGNFFIMCVFVSIVCVFVAQCHAVALWIDFYDKLANIR